MTKKKTKKTKIKANTLVQKAPKSVVTIFNANLLLFREPCRLEYKLTDKKAVKYKGTISTALHYVVWKAMIALLQKEGWRLYFDPKFAKQHLRPDAYGLQQWGHYRGLRFHTWISAFEFKICFTSNTRSTLNLGESYYDTLSHTHQQLFEHVTHQIVQKLCARFHCLFYDASNLQIPPLTAEQQILKYIHEKGYYGLQIRHPKASIQSLQEIEGIMDAKDRIEGSMSGIRDLLHCGEMRWFYTEKEWYTTEQGTQLDQKGWQLRKGIIYHNYDKTWFVILDSYRFILVNCSQILGPVKDVKKAKSKRTSAKKVAVVVTGSI